MDRVLHLQEPAEDDRRTSVALHASVQSTLLCDYVECNEVCCVNVAVHR